jgi:hypothetical protein
MADIKLTGTENVYTQPVADKTTWNRIFGGSGKDVIKLYQGEIIGGAGNDILERIHLLCSSGPLCIHLKDIRG